MQQASTEVVVLGAGYAGLMAAMRLAAKTDGRRVGITLVSERDTFDERVRNHQLAAGQRLQLYPLAAMLQGTRIQFVRGRVIEWQARGGPSRPGACARADRELLPTRARWEQPRRRQRCAE